MHDIPAGCEHAHIRIHIHYSTQTLFSPFTLSGTLPIPTKRTTTLLPLTVPPSPVPTARVPELSTTLNRRTKESSASTRET